MLYHLNSLKRYNNIPRLKQESLAEHLYYTSILITKLLENTNLSVELKYSLLTYTLVHDIQELYTGDIPHNVKKDSPELKTLLSNLEDSWLQKTVYYNLIKQFEVESGKNHNLHELFKLADYLQVIMYTQEELKYGNKHIEIEQIYSNAKRLADELTDRLIMHRVLKSSFNYMQFLESVVGVVL